MDILKIPRPTFSALDNISNSPFDYQSSNWHTMANESFIENYTLHNASLPLQTLLPDVVTTDPHAVAPPAASLEALVCLSLLFCIVGTVGLIGNALVIIVIIGNKKMRRSVTNLFIMNLAVADFFIMLFGIPEIVQFMLNRGWVLGLALCKFQRYVLVVSLYASIMTLVAVCVERYIAIVHPIKAHIFCSRHRIVVAIGLIWPMSLLFGLPTVLYNVVKYPKSDFPVELCTMDLPRTSLIAYIAYKISECVLFFIGPVLIQIVMYAIVGRRLFMGTDKLHRKQTVKEENGLQKEKDSDAIKARKGVVKMLIASVIVYFLSYAPAQVPLFYNMLAPVPFKQNWPFLVLVMTLAYINSAANPILYTIFSQKFRQKFRRVLCCQKAENGYRYQRTASGRADSTFGTTGTSATNVRSVRFALTRATPTTSMSTCISQM